MKWICFIILFWAQSSFGQVLSRSHHFDKIGWTMVLPTDFYIETPEGKPVNPKEEYLTDENYSKNILINQISFKRRYTEIRFNYYNYKPDDPHFITARNVKHSFDIRVKGFLEANLNKDTKLIDSSSSTVVLDGVLFYQCRLNMLQNQQVGHFVLLGAVRKKYYIDIVCLYKNESAWTDVYNMLKNGKFDK